MAELRGGSTIGGLPIASNAIATQYVNGLMSLADKVKLDGIATSANNYSHPTGDGNLHVPATGTSNSGKVLKAGASAGSIAWGSVDWSELVNKPSTFAPSAHTHSDYVTGATVTYTSVTGDDGTDAWYTLFTVSDSTTAPIICNVRAYAHTSLSFVASKGYNAAGGMITILQANTSSTNGSYKYIKGVRILDSGAVQLKLNAGATVMVYAQMISNGAIPSFASTLVKETGTVTAVHTIDPIVHGSIAVYGEIYSGANKVWHAGNLVAVTTSVNGLMSAADKSKLDGIAAGANAYAHPTGDGSLHVPATSTTNNNKVLKAGSTAGSISWGNVAWTELTGSPTTTLVTNLNADMVDGFQASATSAANSIVVQDANQDITVRRVISNMATGTSPFAITSTTVNTNLNSDMTDGYHASTGSAANSIVVQDANQDITVRRVISNIATGTSPFSVTSTTVNTNLNADLLDGQHGSYFINTSQLYVGSSAPASPATNMVWFDTSS